MQEKWKKLLLGVLVTVVTLVLCFAAVELTLRFTRQYVTGLAASELPWMKEGTGNVNQYFTVDPSFGFRPILGNNLYSAYGTLANTYPLGKSAGVARLLFVGDSVTKRAKIVKALQAHYGDRKYEYWNAGVESFNTVQEVEFYQRYNKAIHPDHVILTFHMNDFEPTPVAFFNDKKQLVVYIPYTPLKTINRWFFEKCFTYRWVVGRTLNPAQGRQAIEQDMSDQLRVLRDAVAAEGAQLSVLIMPLVKPESEWTAQEKTSRERILEILRGLGVRHFDLYEPLQEMVRSGKLTQESPGDTWHPSTELADRFAEYLVERNLLHK
jgi:hypothetical protein